MSWFHFPGAVGITHLRVYDSKGSDGLHSGSPHMHLVSAEAYITSAGSGEVQMLSAEGFQTRPLEVGGVVWFEPGVIHRLVNHSHDLEILVVMQNAGLPEAGDAVFTFPADVMTNADAYNQQAALTEGSDGMRREEAWKRRDLAVGGFDELRSAPDLPSALNTFYRAAIERKSHLFDQWSDLLASGAESETRLARQRLVELVDTSTTLLSTGRQASTTGGDDHNAVGMCGMLRQFDALANDLSP